MKSWHAGLRRCVGRYLGTASILTLANVIAAQAQVQQAATGAEQVPEQVLITGSLIRGTVAVGAPVTNLGVQDFNQTGSLTVAELLSTLPDVSTFATLNPAGSTYNYTTQAINIHGLQGNALQTTTLTLIDGIRLPFMGTSGLLYDPSIIPAIALDRVDVLADGASATYGSDAIAGVVNVILKHGYDGAITQIGTGADDGGGFKLDGQVLYGRTWNGGDVTVSYEFNLQQPLKAASRSYYTQNFMPWGLNNDTPVNSATIPIISTGKPNVANGTGCANCYSVPAGQDGVNLTWSQLQANSGTSNEVNPNTGAWITPAHQYSQTALTFDQDILPGIQFNAEAYYANRRTQVHLNNSTLTNVSIPTTNPYYPIGAPAGLVANLSFPEIRNLESDVEITDGYSAGFTVQLPVSWEGKFFASNSEEVANRFFVYPALTVVANNVQAALGGTIAATAATPGSPGIPSFTKPASVPYLNVFCDPTAFNCIDPATLAYITEPTLTDSHFIMQEYNLTFDGPLFALPAGQVKGAIGGDYIRQNYWDNNINFPVTTQVQGVSNDSEGRTVWAGFGQLNIPIFGDGFNFPFVEKLEVEISGRYDNYSDFGGTTNPKYSANWTVTDGVLIRASYGTNFMAPGFKSLSENRGRIIISVNAPGNIGSTAPAVAACTTLGGKPVPGSAAAALNPTCSAAGQFPLGIEIQGGTGGVGPLFGQAALLPQTANNWSLGFDIAPTDGLAGFLKGLDLEATWYNIHINNLITTAGGLNSAGMNDPNYSAFYIVQSDPRFPALLAYVEANPVTSTALQSVGFSNVKFIFDASYTNLGSLDHDGIDFNASYNWDWGALGAWNTGVTGSYTLRNVETIVPGETPENFFSIGGQSQYTRMRYRARLGWANDSGYSATLFMDYQSHIFSTNALPPASYFATYPSYSNLIPSTYLFDVALGYNTGDTPNSDYLKRINISFTVNNIINRNPPFQYGGTSQAYAYYGSTYSPYGRTWLLTVTKQW